MFRIILATLICLAFSFGGVGAVEFEAYKDNYIGFMWHNPQVDTNKDGHVSYQPDQAKFQVSFAANLVELPKFWTHIWMGYTQKSFWNIFDKSSPFKEHDFSPELFMKWSPPVTIKGVEMEDWQLGWEHESNGVAGDDSRGWDRTYITGEFDYVWGGFTITAIPKLWYVVNKSGGNPDIGSTDITGLFIDDFGGTIRLTVAYRDILAIDTEFGAKEGIVQLKIQDDAWAKYFGFLQIYRGKGDSLVEYDDYSTTILAGIALGK